MDRGVGDWRWDWVGLEAEPVSWGLGFRIVAHDMNVTLKQIVTHTTLLLCENDKTIEN